MPDHFVTFRASDVDRLELREILAGHIAYGHARQVRLLFVTRATLTILFACLVAAAAPGLPWSAVGLLTAAASGAVVVALGVELRARRRFTQTLDGIIRRDTRLIHLG